MEQQSVYILMEQQVGYIPREQQSVYHLMEQLICLYSYGA